MSETSKSVTISVASIIVPKLLLREAMTEEEKYMTLRASILNKGITFPLVVTKGTEDGSYILCDGVQRLSIAKELGFDNVEVVVQDLGDSDRLLAQAEYNLTKVDVKDSQYAVFLVEFAHKFPQFTLPELAAKLGVSRAKLDDYLKFHKLAPAVKTAVDEGTISMSKAVLLTGLETDRQEGFIEKAMTTAHDVFAKAVSDTKKEINKAKREGRAPAINQYIHEFGSRPKAELIEEYTNGKLGATLCIDATTPAEGFRLAIEWALKYDPASKAAGLAKWEQQQVAEAEKRERKKQEREAKQAEAKEAAGDVAGATRG